MAKLGAENRVTPAHVRVHFDTRYVHGTCVCADYRDISSVVLAQLAAWVGRGELERCPAAFLSQGSVGASTTSTPNMLTPGELSALRAATSVYSKGSLGAQNGHAGCVSTDGLQQSAPGEAQQQRWQPDGEGKRQSATPELLAALEDQHCFELLERLRSSPSAVMRTATDI